MDEKIVKADRNTKIYYLIVIIILIVAAFFLYRYWQGYYEKLTILAENHPEQALMKVADLIRIVIYINPIVMAGFMIYFIVLGIKTYRSEQFPPPGVKVVRDTKLTEGSKAKKYALGLWFVVLILIVFTILITILLNNFLQTI